MRSAESKSFHRGMGQKKFLAKAQRRKEYKKSLRLCAFARNLFYPNLAWFDLINPLDAEADEVLAQVVDRRVRRDLVEPGRELERGVVALERAVDLDEDLLREVERGLVVADHAEDEVGDRAVVAGDERVEAVGLASRRPRNEVG